LGQYTYDALGRRTKKVVGGTTTLYLYDQNGLLIAEYDGSGNWQKDYLYLNGQPLTMIVANTPENVYYYHNDHLGTPQMMTDLTGTVVWAATYEPFGKVSITVEQITNNLRFPGQYYDSETGLHNNWHRDYNNVIGRYIESDPIGLRGEINVFVYALNNPVKVYDHRGLDAGVEICVRPLAKYPDWLPWWGSPGVHVYIQIGDWSAGFQDDNTVHIPEDNPKHWGRQCWSAKNRDDISCKCKNDKEIQKCIKNFAQQGSSIGGYPDYDIKKDNCGHWVINALKKCCLEPNIPWNVWYPGWGEW
jgi:RHS repeat-associated protein